MSTLRGAIEVNLDEIVKVLASYHEGVGRNGGSPADLEIVINIDGKEYEAQSIWFSSLEREKISICYRSTEPKVAFSSTDGELLK